LPNFGSGAVMIASFINHTQKCAGQPALCQKSVRYRQPTAAPARALGNDEYV